MMQTGKGIDQATYDATKTYLKAALEQMIAAGRSAEHLAEFAADKFGGSFYPYLREFQQDIRSGRIKVQGLTESSRASIFGARISQEERQRLIREAAYLRAEQRQFVGGDPEEDWLAAEADIDEMLAEKAGLFNRGHKALDAARTTAQKEFGSIQTVVYRWIEGKEHAGKVSSASPTKQTHVSTAKTSTAPTRKPAAGGKAEAVQEHAASSEGKPSTRKTAVARTGGAGAGRRRPLSKKPR